MSLNKWLSHLLVLGVLGFFVSTPAQSKEKKEKELIAVFNTNLGTFEVTLMPDIAPKTVANFVGLAKGEKEFVDHKTGQKTKRPYYDGLIFHRIIANFMIQGGDPRGDGRGGPGYQFEDEFEKHPGFSKKGLLAMANAGPNTNGSQFFITVVPTPHLNPRKGPGGYVGGHTIFGEVTKWYELVDKIGKVKTGAQDRPVEPVVIKTLVIEER